MGSKTVALGGQAVRADDPRGQSGLHAGIIAFDLNINDLDNATEETGRKGIQLIACGEVE